MHLNLNNILNSGETIAVALSGGCDSMSLLYYLRNNAEKYAIKVIAVNVEHGIRGESSIADTEFVKNYCTQNGIQLHTFSVDSIKYSKEEKLSIEQSARILRYNCFAKLINDGTCDKIATAHHRDDNVESVLFNIFRGTGLKGLTGITKLREDKIIRPFLSVDRAQIEEYARENGIPFVVDETNHSTEYTRNYIRKNVIPEIKKIFPELNRSVERLTQIATEDDEYLTGLANNSVVSDGKTANIVLPCPKPILSRAVIIALKSLGVKKDWSSVHVNDVIELSTSKNGNKICLLDGVTAIKEYDRIVFYTEREKSAEEKPFSIGEVTVSNKTIRSTLVEKGTIDLKSGLYADPDKIPSTATLRTRRVGDVFCKFGGGSKSLGDYLTDKKIPVRERDELVLLADGNEILVIFGVAVSNKIKVDGESRKIIKFN